MRPASTLSARVAFVSLFAAGVFACAQGTSPETTGASLGSPKQDKEATEPAPPSVSVPESDDPEEPTPAPTPAPVKDAGATTDAATTTTTDAGSTTTDAGSTADAGSTTADAGACVKAAPSNACGVAPQCGCASNETCDVTSTTTGAVSCVLAGGGPLGSVCTTTAQCGKGLTCQYGACRPYCATPGTACGGNTLGVCYQPTNANNATTPNLNVCAIKCDPRTPAGACASNTCLWFPGDQQSDCNAPGTKTKYQPCSSLLDCAAGLQCAFDPLSLGNACLAWCRVGSNADCPGLFEACDDVYGANAPVVNGQKLGLCR